MPEPRGKTPYTSPPSAEKSTFLLFPTLPKSQLSLIKNVKILSYPQTVFFFLSAVDKSLLLKDFDLSPVFSKYKLNYLGKLP